VQVSAFSASVVDVWSRVAARWAPPPRLQVSEFADRELIVTSGPLAGTRWRSDFAPYQPGIMNAFHEPGVQIVVVRSSSQVGKTSIVLAFCAYHVAHDPCSILVVLPTVQPMAEDFSKNRLDPLISASPILRNLFTTKRKKDSSNTILLKTFRGGAVAIAGANSAASLAARPVRCLNLDEVDRYPAELKGEGATISVAMKRTQSFGSRRRILMTSTPTLVGAPIDVWYRRGDQREFRVPCPKCGQPFTFMWKHVRWSDEDPSTARMHCPSCDYGMDDGERLASLADGEWVSTNPQPEPGVVSFALWEAQSPFSSLPDIVAGFLRARAAQKAGDPFEMDAWQNTTLGEPREPAGGEAVDEDALAQLREPYAAAAPAGVCVLVASVDVQDDRLEFMVEGYGVGEECWIVDRRTIPGDTSQPEPWEALERLLDGRYLHTSGRQLGIEATCIDSGGHRTTTVYEFAQRHAARRVYAIIGRDGQRPIVSAPSPRRWGRGQRKIPLYTIGVDSAKKLIADRLALRLRPPEGSSGQLTGPGVMHFPLADWIDAEFWKQLTSERQVKVKHKGVPIEVWKKIRARNETLDLAVYALGAVRLLRPDYASLAAKLAGPPRPPQPPTPAAPTHKPFIPVRPDWLRGRR
jgi:phage terminase large subunit GpA-like protein